MQVLIYQAKGENGGRFEFPQLTTRRYLSALIEKAKANHDPSLALYRQLLEQIETPLNTSKNELILPDTVPMRYLVAELLQNIPYGVYCPSCSDNYISHNITSRLIIDPADPYGAQNGRSFTCPQKHEIFFLSDLVSGD